MNDMYSVTCSKRTVYARCKNPVPRCFLTRTFAPLPNIRVFTDRQRSGTFLCSLLLRGTDDEVRKHLTTVMDLARQTCAACQKQHVSR